MKLSHFIFCFFISGGCCAQEFFSEMNDRAVVKYKETHLQSNTIFTASAGKLLYVSQSSIYDNAGTSCFNQKLRSTHNPEIIRSISKEEKNHKREFIAFAAIPFGIASALVLRQGQTGSSFIKPVGLACISASLSCMILSPVANYYKNRNYRKAVSFYNMCF